jgi:hypothetical protein
MMDVQVFSSEAKMFTGSSSCLRWISETVLQKLSTTILTPGWVKNGLVMASLFLSSIFNKFFH